MFFSSSADKELPDLMAEGLQSRSQLPVNELGIPLPCQARAGPFPQGIDREDHDTPGWSLCRKLTHSMPLKHTVKIRHLKMDFKGLSFHELEEQTCRKGTFF